MELREQLADERVLAIDVMMQVLSRGTEDEFAELMEAIAASQPDPNKQGPLASASGSTASLTQMASAYPLYTAPAREQQKTTRSTTAKIQANLTQPEWTV